MYLNMFSRLQLDVPITITICYVFVARLIDETNVHKPKIFFRNMNE
jgi:hypothetical protein